MFEPGQATERDCCPCGHEGLVTSQGPHFLGANCREQVARHVRRRFGGTRRGGRYAQFVEDFIHDCYVRLLAPGGLDSFRLLPGRELPDAFRAWLHGVVRYYCNNKGQYIETHVDLDAGPLEGADETPDPISAEAAFARQHLGELLQHAIAEVEPNWRAKGPAWSERFDVLLPLVLGEDTDHERARQRLRASRANARKLKWTLVEEIRASMRRQVRDDLFLEPGVTAKEIERRISAELAELIQLAFPEKKTWLPFFRDGEPEPSPTLDPDADDEPSERKS